MLVKKLIKIIGITLILYFIGNYTYDKIKMQHSTIEQQKIIDEYNTVNYYNVPFIEIGNIVRIIKDDTDKKTLDENYVGIYNTEKDIRKVHNIILAGHSITGVFKILHTIEIGSEIKIYYKEMVNTYQITNKIVIDIDDFSYFNETDEDRLTLITCVNNKKKRLIVIAEKID
jgi:LPXTG-site transpeptidase (sortase) family protein